MTGIQYRVTLESERLRRVASRNGSDPSRLGIGLIAIGLLAIGGAVRASEPPGFKDDFDGKALASRWQWHVPERGPTLAFGGGRVRITVPGRRGGYNQWNGVFQAPVLSAPALPGDWELQARVRLVKFGPGSSFHVALVALISDRHVVSWGPFLSPLHEPGATVPKLVAETTGRGGLVESHDSAGDVQLKLEKRGDTYRCFRRERDRGKWRHCGDFTNPFPIRRVGILAKTFGDGPEVVAEVDWIAHHPISYEAPDPTEVKVSLHPKRAKTRLDPKRFGHFIEHLGR
ncbi:MAG: hypothetical protein ACYS99_10085, partial [Planctomycetota bacterium]